MAGVQLARFGKDGVEAVCLRHVKAAARFFQLIWRLCAHKEIVRLDRILNIFFVDLC